MTEAIRKLNDLSNVAVRSRPSRLVNGELERLEEELIRLLAKQE